MASSPTRARVFIGACLIASAVYFAAPPTLAAVVYDALGLAAAVALLVGARLRPRGRRGPWYLLASGMLAWVGGDAYWSVYEISGAEAPFPSVADAIYLAAYPLWTVALLVLARRKGGRADLGVLLDAGVVMVAAGLLAWIYLIEPEISADQPTLTIAVGVAYPLADVLALGVLARLLLGPTRHTPSYRLLVAGLTATLVADTAYSIALLGPGYEGGSWIDLGWLLFYALWGAAALSPAPEEVEIERAERPLISTSGRLAMIAASVVPPTLALASALRGDASDAFAIALATVTTFLLTGVRTGMMLTSLERTAEDLSAQGRTLRRALEDLGESQAERGRLLDRTVQATEEERALMAVELHDGPIQHLTALTFRLGKALSRLRAGDVTTTDEVLAQAELDLGDDIRELRRLMSDLRPPALDEGGLVAALRDQLDVFRQRAGTEVTFDARLDHELDSDTQVVLYRITQEALANVAKHARAGHVRVQLSTPNRHTTLEIDDDGVGFEEGRAREFARDGHFGLAGMAQRASMVGGTLEVRSTPGGGTSVRVDVPMARGR
jgi:signal transduction histidine kinase